MGVVSEFKDFLNEYKILGVAVAFIMGIAVNDLVRSLVDNIIMPIVEPVFPSGEWQTATLTVGPFVLKWGPFVSALINFLILSIVVFMIVKKGTKLLDSKKR